PGDFDRPTGQATCHFKPGHCRRKQASAQNRSPDGHQDLSDYLALFLRKAKQNADVSRLVEEVTGRDKKGVFE
ncbi:hypothetical protein, partial [Bradyrhizobium japonicum]|uniref:hypothetical protein n=1 Tax=Bradyrhizobium japonicum TaxID=375 RepID=UPI001AEC643E